MERSQPEKGPQPKGSISNHNGKAAIFNPENQQIFRFRVFQHPHHMSQRMQRVGELVKREIGTCLERDFEFPDILVTVQHVDVAPNLRTARVYVGVIGEESKREGVIEKLNAKHGFIQKQVTKRVVLKYTPRLTFTLDDSVERGVRVVNLIDDLGEIPEHENE